jgi:lincosamide nucleotidyltransferase
MLYQQELINQVRRLCLADKRLDAVLMYGSFAHGEGDRHSDIEFWLYFAPGNEEINPLAWCSQIGPLTHIVVNEFGAHVVFFPGLVRGEFHFATSDDINALRSWPAQEISINQMVILDRRGALQEGLEALRQRGVVPPLTKREVEELCGRFANWLVLAYHVTERGEHLRAVDALAHMQRHLLSMARLVEGQTRHWLTPSRAAEVELSEKVIEHLQSAIPQGATQLEVRHAIYSAWLYGRLLWERLAAQHTLDLPYGLFQQMDQLLTQP